ncbi:hypothetical protein SDAV_00144 [Spiroplasma phoeniceum P40]|uniref:Uncharacterized protein n=1 Tax=Spiroplasma phoeniceum P40 TaxID=1276259 RepID=A0A345DLR0_9MOLU|nr:hypothetical protein SDAV_00144 [Spiroplasma phoeniceum P40]
MKIIKILMRIQDKIKIRYFLYIINKLLQQKTSLFIIKYKLYKKYGRINLLYMILKYYLIF